MTLLDIQNLSLSIGGADILHDVSLQVAAGQVHGLIGESGSGKSMTAAAVMQLMPNGAVTKGQVVLDGLDVTKLSESDLCKLRGRDVGMVFQEPMTALNPLQTIGAQVAEAISIHNPNLSRADAKAQAADALERCELPTAQFPLSRYPHELSGGQKQRVVIAIATALRPKLLIADEPTTALDVTTQAEILTLLKSLVHEQGMGLLLITHDLAVVAQMADHISVMQNGRIVEDGAGVPFLADLQHPYSQSLLAASGHKPTRAKPMGTKTVLMVKDACFDYPLPKKSLFQTAGKFRAVDGVSFEIAKGEILGLVGESGCGKTTLSRMVLALTQPTAGKVMLDSEQVDADGAQSRSQRQKVQAVFQDPYASFNPRHKVARLIAEPLNLLPRKPDTFEVQEKVTLSLKSVGLKPSDAYKYIHEFSGGQRQRIAIARALILKPKLIVLDEAVSALDVSIRAQILDLLADLSSKHDVAYLFISHDLSVVQSFCDRVLVMKNGRIVEEGDTDTVIQSPQSDYTKQLFAAAPQLPKGLVP